MRMTKHIRLRGVTERSSAPPGWICDAVAYKVDGAGGWVPNILFPDELSWLTVPVPLIAPRPDDLGFLRSCYLKWLVEWDYIIEVRVIEKQDPGQNIQLIVEDIVGPSKRNRAIDTLFPSATGAT